MNKEWVLFHLREAAEELSRVIHLCNGSQEYSDIEFEIDIGHLYNHINTPWNARNVEPERVAACSQEDFFTWRDFPADINMRR